MHNLNSLCTPADAWSSYNRMKERMEKANEPSTWTKIKNWWNKLWN